MIWIRMDPPHCFEHCVYWCVGIEDEDKKLQYSISIYSADAPCCVATIPEGRTERRLGKSRPTLILLDNVLM